MKALKWIFIVLAVFALLYFFVGRPYLTNQTKKHSPERTSQYSEDGLDLSVHYSSPFKKDRVIFGELVPYNTVWRTGANEPTTFTTASELAITGQELAPGTYSLWTIPREESWTVIFNREIPDWGVTVSSGGAQASRDPQQDVLKIEVPVRPLEEPVESFTIDFEEEDKLYLCLYWDTTKVSVPISK